MKLDLRRLPRGQREWREFLDALAQVDDSAERYFLELKSELDMTNKTHRAKVAKFVLGAANRPEELAGRRFEGHALLVIGVAGGQLTGIPAFEARELADSVRQFIGPEGPGWDYETVRVAAGRDVVIVIAHPPRERDQPWTCLKDGPENLQDGGIYIRADGETRHAKGEEIRAMLRRSVEAPRPTALTVEVIGQVLTYSCSKGPLGHFVEQVARDLRGKADIAPSRTDTATLLNTPQLDTLWAAMQQPEDRSPEVYEQQIVAWVEEAQSAFGSLVDGLAGFVGPPAFIRITNRSKVFLEELEVRLHLAGQVRAVDAVSSATEIRSCVPPAPRPWGPRQRAFGWGPHQFPTHQPLVHFRQGSGTVTYRNGGSVVLGLTLPSLRPLETFDSDDDQVVLCVEGPIDPLGLTGAWTATARGVHDVFEGDVTVPATTHKDLTQLLQAALEPLRDSDGYPLT